MFVRRSAWGIAALAMCHLLAASGAVADYPQIRVNSRTSEKQHEQQIVVNPTDPQNIVACWVDISLQDTTISVGIGHSLDGGWTWTDFPAPGELPWNVDPALTADRDGTFYLVVMNYYGFGELGPSRLLVHRSTTSGASWEGPFRAAYTDSTQVDKPWITVDRTGGERDGHLYIAWKGTHLMAGFYIKLARSTDRGMTWSAPVTVSDFGGIQWPVPIVLRNGNVLVAWDDTIAPTTITYDISTNGGATWGTDRVLTTVITRPGSLINGGILFYPYPSLAVDETSGPQAGWAYCVYADAAVPGNGLDIWCQRSTDNGETWSSRVRVNDDLPGLVRDQFHPWVTCDEQGILHASWYDRRDDPGNYLWHVYYARSLDGGASWEPSIRITTVVSSPDNGAGGFGEYSGIAAKDGLVHPIWTDTRNGDQDCYTSIIATTTDAPADLATPGRSGGATWLRVVPNPVRETAMISFDGDLASSVLQIFDVHGRAVDHIRPDGERFAWTPGPTTPPGVYFAVLGPTGSNVVKFLVIR